MQGGERERGKKKKDRENKSRGRRGREKQRERSIVKEGKVREERRGPYNCAL